MCREDETTFEVITAPEDFEAVKAAIDELQAPYISSEVTMLPQTTTSLAGKEADQMVRLMDMLEDCDDVQKVTPTPISLKSWSAARKSR